MYDFYHDLEESLKTGFIDHSILSKKEYRPQFLINDKLNGKKVLSTIDKGMRECNEFWFSVAFVTKSGVATLLNVLQELKQRKIRGKILVSQYQNFTQPEALKSLLQFDNIDLRIMVEGDFHAKGYLFKKENGYDLIIGSSNLTASALCANKEWNLKITATENSQIIADAIKEFQKEFEGSVVVDNNFIRSYEDIYQAQIKFFAENENKIEAFQHKVLKPNAMQSEALINLNNLRKESKSKALLISATGTGKTYLSAFDVKEVNPKRFLFLVHRANIAETAMKSFKKVFGESKSMGLYSGQRKEVEAEYIFSTVQTISRDYNLSQFEPDHFDYIVIDETHRAGADTYQKILNHFKPEFLLGMTATPERTDGFDIFNQFDYNIAYEIRLHRALEEQMLCPFHYYGVTDVSVDDYVLEENASFNLLIAEERVNKIIEKAEFYGCDNGCVRGLIFCSNVKESAELSKAFNLKGYRTISLSGDNSEAERAQAIIRLESDNEDEKLDYIFTVDIFNEGIDIPRVNQVIMLRPTQSAIVFVQQLGRGLRKTENKDYLTVIDFIGNYNNNYMVPIALYGDTSYNKDSLRKLMVSGSSLLPGESTINFDKIAREKIFAAIDKANLNQKKDLVKDYQLLKFEIGRMPLMVDFIEHGSRDPFSYVLYSKSYFNFVASIETNLLSPLTKEEMKLLELFSQNITNAKRIEEVIILQELLKKSIVSTDEIKKIMDKEYSVSVSDATISSCIRNINFEFISSTEKVITFQNNIFEFEPEFLYIIDNITFKSFFSDALEYARLTYNKHFDRALYFDGFILYQKYSRKDVCRILNWEKDEHSTMYGYKVKHGTCPIFVNYHKDEGIAQSTKYEDGFTSNYEFEWMSRSRRTLDSGEIVAIRNYQDGLRIPLFIKKSNDEGNDFYYMGEVSPTQFDQSEMLDDSGKNVPVVKVKFAMNYSVKENIYEYITTPIN